MTIDTTNMCSHLQKKLFEPDGVYYPIWQAMKDDIAMGAHATTENLNDCPDFTVAFATKQTMVAADFVGIVSAKNDADKIVKTGWNVKKSENVNAPVFTDFPMTLECRIKEKIDESAEGYYIVV